MTYQPSAISHQQLECQLASLQACKPACAASNTDMQEGKGECATPELQTPRSKLLNESGIAFVMILILSAIALAVMAGMLYMITSGTVISGIQKRYTTALEAGKGGTDAIYQLIGARGDPGIPGISLTITATDACLTDKLNNPTSATDWNDCSDFNKASSLTIDTGDTATYDMRFDLGNYRVYSKISDTIEGNSGADEGLLKTGVVLTNPGEIQVQSIPYYYTIEVHSENPDNIDERSKLSVLYQY